MVLSEVTERIEKLQGLDSESMYLVNDLLRKVKSAYAFADEMIVLGKGGKTLRVLGKMLIDKMDKGL